MNKNISIIGFMASGKSYLGKRIARLLNYEFIDLDEKIEETAGISISEIFAKVGEEGFRKIEKDCLLSTVSKVSLPYVLATGGGLILDSGNQEFLKSNSILVFLNPCFDDIFKRLGNSAARPLAKNKDIDKLRLLWEKRLPIYRELANIETDCIGEEDQVVAKILKQINTHFLINSEGTA